MSTAVLVIDMVRGFMEPGYNLYLGERGRSIIPNVVRLLKQEQSGNSPILYLCDNHDPDDLEFKIYGPHCVAGTIETEVIPELAGFKGEYIPKKRYSSFYNTGLDNSLTRIKPDKLIICGVCTEICVCFTTSDARNRDYAVEIPVNCVAPCFENWHQFALDHMEKVLGAKLITI
jgi:nicotinamidase-related amidase